LWALAIGWFLFSPRADYASGPAPAGRDAGGADLFWFKGNTHSHAQITLQDYTHGDSPARQVAAWYRDHGYHFVSITDHNRFEDGSALLAAGDSDFLVLSGMEVTSDYLYPGVTQKGKRRIHATALNTGTAVDWDFENPQKADIIRQQAMRIHDQGGLHILNHPNYRFQVEFADILDS
jgi:predicted metal-dependent phosphoesterase TrpH